MTKRERLIWAAGLLEGEGCFRVKRGSRPGYRDSLLVNVGSTDRDVVDRVCATFEGHGKVQSRTREGVKTMHYAEWYGTAAEKVMRAVLPFMCERRAAKIAACLASENLSHHPGRKWPTPAMESAGK